MVVVVVVVVVVARLVVVWRVDAGENGEGWPRLWRAMIFMVFPFCFQGVLREGNKLVSTPSTLLVVRGEACSSSSSSSDCFLHPHFWAPQPHDSTWLPLLL